MSFSSTFITRIIAVLWLLIDNALDKSVLYKFPSALQFCKSRIIDGFSRYISILPPSTAISMRHQSDKKTVNMQQERQAAGTGPLPHDMLQFSSHVSYHEDPHPGQFIARLVQLFSALSKIGA